MTNSESADNQHNADATKATTNVAETGTDKTKGANDTQQTSDLRDVQSDPALNDSMGQEWADEGGATADGPATSSD